MAKDINRRDFFKVIGASALSTSALLSSCRRGGNDVASEEEPDKDKMTYRVNPKTGEKVSILGYGMMRLPVVDRCTE